MDGDKRASDPFAARMHGYEAVAQGILMSRMPVIIRVDGKNFRARTRGMKKPFDEGMRACMQVAALRLCAEVQNCRMAYFQSDEISLLLTDFQLLNTETWFGNQVQKVCSVAAATATAAFIEGYLQHFSHAPREHLPTFDGRCFNVPREDVTNYFVWRQRDAERNSISMAAQAHFSHKELQGLNRSQMMDLLMLRKGINWDDYEPAFKRGQVVVRDREASIDVATSVVRPKWVVRDAPIFSKDRETVDVFLREVEMRT